MSSPFSTRQCFAMSARLACFFFFSSSAERDIHLRGSSVPAPHQPVKSLPLKRALKPGGGSLSAAYKQYDRTAVDISAAANLIKILFCIKVFIV